jgi:hypothetical protein
VSLSSRRVKGAGSTDAREDIDQIARRQICNLEAVNVPNLLLNISQLHITDANEVQKAGFVGDQVIARLIPEHTPHEVIGDPLEERDAHRGRQLDRLAFERTASDAHAVFAHPC